MPERVTRFIHAKLCLRSAGVFILIQEREDKRISLNYIENYYGEFFQPGGGRFLLSRPTKGRHKMLEGCRILLHQCVYFEYRVSFNLCACCSRTMFDLPAPFFHYG